MGSRLGGWEVTGELGRGGQGVVLRARHAAHGTPAAIKLLLRQEQRTALRFRQEAAVLQRLDHPNLVRVLDAGEHEGAPFLAMELVEGQSLAGLVREGGPPPFERTARLLAAVARAVHHCHANGVVHRDLKPENVIVERGTGRPVLVDFGMVKRDRELFGALSIDELTRLSRTGELRGTPMYMAPEQVSSGGEVGPWTDVHALGAVLHVLLTGEPPWDADSLPGVVHAILAQPPPDPRAANPAVPAALARVCLSARAKARAERPRSAAAFAAALEAAVGARRGGGLVAAVAAGLVVAGGAAAGVVAATRRGPIVAVAPVTTALAGPVASSDDPGSGDAAIGSGAREAAVERALDLVEREPELALALAEEALAADPARLRARGARALALFALGRRGRPGGSDGPLRELIAVDPTLGWAELPGGGPDPRLLDAWALRAAWRSQRGDDAGAAADVGTVLALRPDDAWALVLRAELRLNTDDAAGALADLDRVLARDVTLGHPWSLRAEARLRRGDPRGALQDMAEARARSPQALDALCTSARALVALGDHEGAVAELTRLLGQSGRDEVTVRLHRANSLDLLGRAAEAAADVEALLRLAPRQAQALSWRGAFRLRTGQPELAAADFAAGELAAAELDPAGQAAYFEDRARRRRVAGDLEAALADAERAVALAPGWGRAHAMRGTALLTLERPREALAAFDAAVAAEPGSGQAHLERGQAREMLKDPAGAIADLDRALALGGIDAPRAHVARCWNHLDLGDPDAALADAQRCVDLDPTRWDGWMWRGKARRAKGELALALEDLDQAVARAEGTTRPLEERVDLKRAMGDGPGAVADATRLVELDPGVEAWTRLGIAHRAAKDDARAVAAFDRAIELAGETAAAGAPLQHRASCRRAARDLAGALADLERANALRPGWWGGWYDLGALRSQMGDRAAAIEAHGQAIERASGKDLATPLHSRAALRRAEGDLAGALADYDRAIELAPERWALWNDRGYARQKAKDLPGALADYDRALALAPEQLIAWRNRSAGRRAAQEWEGAEADLDRALALDPKDGPSLASRGWLRQRRGALAPALEDLTQAIELGADPVGNLRVRSAVRRDLGDVEGALADLGLALSKDPRAVPVLLARSHVLREWRRDLDGALADEEAALAIDPAAGGPWRQRALTRLLRGDAAGARADADEAVRLGSDSFEAFATRARVRAALGDGAGARADAERALVLDPLSATSLWAHGVALLACGDATGAVAACTSSIAAFPRAPRALATRAEALVALGRPSDALADLDRASALEPGRPDALLQRAALREATGDRAGAAADLRAALALLRPGDPRRPAASAGLARLER